MRTRGFFLEQADALRCLQGRFYMKHPGYIGLWDRVVFVRDRTLPIGGLGSGLDGSGQAIIALSDDFLDLPMKAQTSGLAAQFEYLARLKGWEDEIARERDRWKARREAESSAGKPPHVDVDAEH